MKVTEGGGGNRTGVAIGVFVALVLAATVFADPPNTPRARSYQQPAPATASSVITPSTDISPRSVTTPFVDAGLVFTQRLQLNEGVAASASLTGQSDGTIVTGNGGTTGGFNVMGLLKTFNDFRLFSDAYDDGVDIGSSTGRFRILSLSRSIYLGVSHVFSGRAVTLSGFGTSPSVVAGRGVAFRVDVGTGGTASSGTVTFGDAAANGYICNCTVVPAVAGEETITTAVTTTTCVVTNRTIATGVAAAWAASSDIWCTGTGY